MTDSTGEPVHVTSAPWLDPDLSGQARLEALLFPAIDQVLEDLDPAEAGTLRMAISLALPSVRPGVPTGIQDHLVRSISMRYDGMFDACASFRSGHAGGLMAMDAAFAKLSRGGLDACVVAAVDSYIEPRALRWLEENDQLHGAGPLNNAWGFIPGEAAGALLVMRDSIAQRLSLPTHAVVLGGAVALEANCIKTETVCIGHGLTEALRGAMAGLPAAEKVSDIYCDLNGEPYRADEYGFACLRVGESLESASDFVAPADCWGDVAAAGGVLHLLLATVAGVKGYANGNLALTWASGEAGERAAVLVDTGRRP